MKTKPMLETSIAQSMPVNFFTATPNTNNKTAPHNPYAGLSMARYGALLCRQLIFS